MRQLLAQRGWTISGEKIIAKPSGVCTVAHVNMGNCWKLLTAPSETRLTTIADSATMTITKYRPVPEA